MLHLSSVFTKSARVKLNRVFFPVKFAKPVHLAVFSLDIDRDICFIVDPFVYAGS
jgi:hypothetical protein